MINWRTADSILLGLVVSLATVVRLVGLGFPDRLVFDESYYATDACAYLHLGRELCGGVGEASWVHPPLGKWLIALGIAIGGYEPAAWRSTAAIAGIVMVAAAYLLTRRLTDSTLGAGLAGGFIALDPLSIVSSRVAMLDIVVACAGVLAVLFVVLHRDSIASGGGGTNGLLKPWLFAAGVCCGVAVATKWSGVLVLAIALALTLAWEVGAPRATGRRMRALVAVAPSILVCFVLLPVGIYVASYIGRLDGVLFAPPWQQDAWPRVFGGRQLRMATFHIGLDERHPYASPAWSWALGKRAVTYFFEVDAAGRYRHILAFANLALWVPALLAAVWAAITLATRRQIWRAEFVIVAAVAGTYLPWLVFTIGRPFVFLHYIVPTIPFLGLALAWAVVSLPPRVRPWTAAAFATVAIAGFLMWAPLIYGWPLSYDDWRTRILFTDCPPDQVVDGKLAPRPHPGPPPDGWCWV